MQTLQGIRGWLKIIMMYPLDILATNVTLFISINQQHKHGEIESISPGQSNLTFIHVGEKKKYSCRHTD
jgi:hypothetical protein